MPTTSPNQKIITVHRAPLSNNFLGINNDNWKHAARVLGAQGFLLYIYLASNKDQYKLGLSPAAVQKEIGMPRSTFYDQLRKLESLGFLVPPVSGNMYQFYETPQSFTPSDCARVPLKRIAEENTAAVCLNPAQLQNCPQKDIEININNKERIINIPEEYQRLQANTQKEETIKEGFNF